MDWQADMVLPLGHEVPFCDVLCLVSTGLFTKILTPHWAMELTPKWAKVRAAFDELEVSKNPGSFLGSLTSTVLSKGIHARNDRKLADSGNEGGKA